MSRLRDGQITMVSSIINRTRWLYSLTGIGLRGIWSVLGREGTLLKATAFSHSELFL